MIMINVAIMDYNCDENMNYKIINANNAMIYNLQNENHLRK